MTEEFLKGAARMFGRPIEELWVHTTEFVIEIDPGELEKARQLEDVAPEEDECPPDY